MECLGTGHFEALSSLSPVAHPVADDRLTVAGWNAATPHDCEGHRTITQRVVLRGAKTGSTSEERSAGG